MKKMNRRFVVFVIVGVFNTLFDLALYLVVYDATHSIVWANLAATSVAMLGSYALNSKVTFKSKTWTGRSFALFLGVTLFGLWVLQTGLIYCFTRMLSVVPASDWHALGGLGATARTLAPKLFATAFTFVWNFVWYNKVIFRNTHQGDTAATPSEEALLLS